MGNESKKRPITISVKVNNAKCLVIIAIALICGILCVFAQASVKAMLVLISVLLILAPIHLECSKVIAKRLETVWYLFAMPVTLCLTQILLNQTVLGLDADRLLLGCLCIGVFMNFLYLIARHRKISVVISTLALMLLTTANYFVFSFRGSEFAPYDFLAFGTAAEVAGQYQYQIDAPFAYAWCALAIYLACGYCIPKRDHCKVRSKEYFIHFLAELLAVGILFIGLNTIEKKDYRNEGSATNGYLLNFVKRIDFTPIEIPEGYSLDYIGDYESLYSTNDAISATGPDVIVVMNESFSDLRIMGELNTNIDIIPFYDSLLKNTIHGYALASSIGGGTCNSEYQFLTGNNMGFLPDGAYPFQQYINTSAYSIFSQMEEYGYKTIATHPEQPTNWMRTTVYPLIGVDAFYSIDDYPQSNMIRQHVSDQETYEKVIELYENACLDQTGSIFIFGITMQNHGGYDIPDFQSNVQLQGYPQEHPAAEQYLSLLHHSDNALEYLVSYYEQVERDVVLLLFGDHLPQFADSFYTELHGGTFDTLEERMLQYTVPFFVWANFDIKERDVGLTSLNFLSNYVYEAAGLPLPAYNAFLKDVQSVIPAMNAFGYYSKENEAFIPYEEAEGKEADALNRYRILQYNCLFDEKNRSQIFFPTANTEVS